MRDGSVVRGESLAHIFEAFGAALDERPMPFLHGYIRCSHLALAGIGRSGGGGQSAKATIYVLRSQKSASPNARKEKRACESLSADEMRSYYAEEFARCDDFGVLPEFGEMALVTRHKVVCTSGIGAFDEHIVCRVRRNLSQMRRFDHVSMILDQLQQLLPQTPANLEPGRGRDHLVSDTIASETHQRTAGVVP